MAEALGVAASAISVAAFAGQLAQSFASLYTLFSDYRNAFREVERLSTELRLVSSLLTTIERSFSGSHTDADLKLVLEHCGVIVKELSQVVTTLGPVQGAKKRHILRKQLRAALKLPELAKHANSLGRAKLMLIQCCANLTRQLQVGDSSILHGLQGSLSGVATHQSAVVDSIVETKAAVESLDGPLARLETTALGTQDIVETIQATTFSLESSSSRVEELQMKTYTIAKNLKAESCDLREQTETMKLVSREIADQVHNGYPAFRRALAHDMEQAMSTGLRQIWRDIHERLIDSAGTSSQGAIPRFAASDNAVLKPHISSSPHTQDYVCPKQAPPEFQGQHARAVARWTRKSAAVSWHRVFNVTLFGTLIARTTTTSYVRRRPTVSDGDPDMETKEESQTSITFLPATWLSLSGAKFRYGTMAHPAPAWSLHSVNVIPSDSDIFLYCSALDLDGIRNLFDESRASPFDVDEGGRNLLGHLAFGARIVHSDGEPPLEVLTDIIQQRLQKLFAIVDMLVGYGLDASELDETELNPLMLFALCWFEYYPNLGIAFGDELQFLLSKLLKCAKSDPLAGFNHAIIPDRRGMYIIYEYLHDEQITPLALQILTRQEEWPMAWHDRQIAYACDLGCQAFYGDTRNYVGFWVTSTFQEAEKYLQMKTDLLRMLITAGIHQKEHCAWGLVLHSTIHGGAEVIALLSEHSYGGKKAPWLRHRFQKLVLVREYLVQTLKLLLQVGGTKVADLQLLDEVSQHAQKHNARTFSAWRNALEEAAQDLGINSPPSHEYQHRDSQSQRISADGSHKPDENTSEDGEWETEEPTSSGSDWETEEEWEDEGYMLRAAVDKGRLDDANPELRRTRIFTSCSSRHGLRGADISPDYDEDYWSHVYERIDGSNLDSGAPEPAGKKLMGVARAVRNFVSYFV